MLIIEPATDDDIYRAIGFKPAGIRVIFTARQDGKPIGLCGVIRDPTYVNTIMEDEGRWIGFFELNVNPEGFGFRAIMRIAQELRAMGEEIWVQCDDSFPTAERFCQTLGFKPTDEFSVSWRDPKRTLRMWRWQR